MYNNFRYNNEFKKVHDRAVLSEELAKKKAMEAYIEYFTIGRLSECKFSFVNYVNKYGKKKPVRTAYPKFNYYANVAISLVGFRVHQPYADEVKQIIDKLENEKLSKDEETIKVFNALLQIKEVYDKMKNEGIREGSSVFDGIINLFKAFNLHFKGEDLKCYIGKDDITHEEIYTNLAEINITFQSYPKQYLKERIISFTVD